MFKFLKRKSSQKTANSVKAGGEYSVYIPEESLVGATAQIEGKPCVCVFNKSLLDLSPKEPFRWYLSIIIRYDKTVGDEMPEGKDVEVMQDFIDNLCVTLAEDKDHPNALFLGRVTGDGKTHAMWYVNNPEKAHQLLQTIINKKKYPIDFEYVMREDPEFREAHWWLDPLQ